MTPEAISDAANRTVKGYIELSKQADQYNIKIQELSQKLQQAQTQAERNNFMFQLAEARNKIAQATLDLQGKKFEFESAAKADPAVAQAIELIKSGAANFENFSTLVSQIRSSMSFGKSTATPQSLTGFSMMGGPR